MRIKILIKQVLKKIVPKKALKEFSLIRRKCFIRKRMSNFKGLQIQVHLVLMKCIKNISKYRYINLIGSDMKFYGKNICYLIIKRLCLTVR